MAIELKITFKDEERKLTKDFNIYDSVMFDERDPIIQKALQEVKSEFKGDPEHIIVKATMVLK